MYTLVDVSLPKLEESENDVEVVGEEPIYNGVFGRKQTLHVLCGNFANAIGFGKEEIDDQGSGYYSVIIDK